MRTAYEDLTMELRRKNIRLSHQRLKVLEYLSKNFVHPTADQVHKALVAEVPTLSKTTVYSTLNVLAEAGLIRIINIEDTETRYDINVHDHGHFKCDGCGIIYDFKADPSELEKGALDGFEVRDKNIYFKGLCPDCLAKKN